MKLKTTPFPYQQTGVELIEGFGNRALLADDMGLGKSYQALYLCYRNPDLLPAVVTCPASVKYHWESNAAEHFGLRATVLEGQTPRPLEDLSGKPRLIVVNHDILHYWARHLRDLNPQLVIIDESQAFMNRSSLRTKALRVFAAEAPHVIALSGSPLLNAPAELFPTINILWPEEFPGFTEFGQRYCKPEYRFGKWTYKGATRLPELHAKLRACGMIRRLKADVQKDLPGQMVRVKLVDMSDRTEYNYAANDFTGWLRDNGRYAARDHRVLAMVKVGELLRLAARYKMKAVVGWANKFLAETDEKLILFGYHTKCLEVLRRRCKAESVLIDGSVTGRRRQAAVDKFRLDPKCRLAVCQLHAGGVGLDGLQVASTVGFCELWWRPGDFLQAAARADRIGQKSCVWVNYFIAWGTVEEALCKVNQRKQSNISAVLDGKGEHQEVAVFDLLMEELQRKANGPRE